MDHGILYVISAPSGTGKSTVARALLDRVRDVEFSVSYTTRPRRAGERDGHDYHFVDRARFRSMIDSGSFLEWADVFGQLYGTGIEPTRKALEDGRNLLLDIDVQGAGKVHTSDIPSVSVMLLPPDFRTLEQRLRNRGSESEEDLARRLARAREEAEDCRFFDYLVINDDLDRTVSELESIVRAERCRTKNTTELARRILATFPLGVKGAKEI